MRSRELPGAPAARRGRNLLQRERRSHALPARRQVSLLKDHTDCIRASGASEAPESVYLSTTECVCIPGGGTWRVP